QSVTFSSRSSICGQGSVHPGSFVHHVRRKPIHRSFFEYCVSTVIPAFSIHSTYFIVCDSRRRFYLKHLIIVSSRSTKTSLFTVVFSKTVINTSFFRIIFFQFNCLREILQGLGSLSFSFGLFPQK